VKYQYMKDAGRTNSLMAPVANLNSKSSKTLSATRSRLVEGDAGTVTAETAWARLRFQLNGL
jgi:hypothetical protein